MKKEEKNKRLLGFGLFALFLFAVSRTQAAKFDLNEFTVSETADRLKMASQKNPAQFQINKGSAFFMQWLKPLKETFGNDLIVNSWWRSDELNEEIGGVSDSEHLEGLAIDLTLIINGVRRNDLLFSKILELQAQGRQFNQLIKEDKPETNPQHIHLSWSMNNNNKNQILFFDGNKYYTLN